MALILSIETSSKNCSVAISKNTEVLYYKEEFDEGYCHGERLHVLINELLQECSLSIHNMDAFALSHGPGSYTGLRIGASAAKGFAFVLNKPIILIPTLESLAKSYSDVYGDSNNIQFICPILDSRQGEVYAAVYNNTLNVVLDSFACVLSSHSFEEILNKGKCIFFGTGLDKVKSVLNHKNANFINDDWLPSSRSLSVLSHKKFIQKDFADIAYFEPLYLKNFMPARPKKKFNI
tara:strand:- start:233 stop:937 length:705 start_codon:yes stop_codon:yes gene_type:complete